MDAIATALNALLAAPGQHGRLLRLHTPLGPNRLVAEAMHGHESVDGGGFRLQATALSTDAHLPLDELLGKPALLELLTAESQTRLRPFHGHVTAFERVGSNGGLARYRLTLEPWLGFLRERVDSYVFQDKTVVEIVEDVFADYTEAGALAPAWRWDLSDRDVYRKRSLTVQYEESDFAFVERLLAEEGIGYWFEHDGDPSSETFGRHTLVLFDHNAAFADGGPVRYHRADATERGDGVQQWSRTRRWQTGRLSRASWDYRSLGLRPAEADGEHHGEVRPEDVDTSGPYGWPDAETGARRARQHLEARQVEAQQIRGEGTWRRLSPGLRFELTQHPNHAGEAARFACLRVEHAARSNLGADVFDALEQALGPVAAPGVELPSALAGLTPDAERTTVSGIAADTVADFYRNTFLAIPEQTPYRPRTVDGHGLRLHPKPVAHGTQSAIVVSDGAPVLTDRDHRIKVQFPWQRGGDASSGTAHPGGDDNGPGNDGAWTWVRVATPWAGDNWGGVAIPRKGQEVLVAFLEGDIDRPVVVGAVYNGRGNADAAHNQVAGGGAGATGNAAAWFDGNDHAAVYTGFKTQALAQSQDGGGGHQLLRLDDTPGQGRVQAATTQHATTLTLGHLKGGGSDNVREGERGFGAELGTQASGAIRAGRGLLLTTEPGEAQLQAPQALAQLAEGERLLQSLADTARSQQAALPDDAGTLPVQQTLRQVQESLEAVQQGSTAAAVEGAGKAISGGEGEAPGWNKPQLVAGSPDGIVSLTPVDQAWVSGTQTGLIAGADLDWASQGETVIAVAGGIALFTQGGQPPSGKPNQETGIALHAAQGKVSARAHRGVAKVAAKTRITLASTQADVEAAAPNKHVLLTATGAYLKLEGGDIELGAPGTIEFKATKKDWTSPQAASGEPPQFGEAAPKFCELEAKQADAFGGGLLAIAMPAAIGGGASGGGGGVAQVARLARAPGAAQVQQGWKVADVLKLLCPEDKAVVDQLAQTEVNVADRIYFDDPYYDGTAWGTRRFEAGGTSSAEDKVIGLLSGAAPEDAATTIYHEVRHQNQPASMSWRQKEQDAYSATEAWTIAKGLPGQAGDDLRTVVDGKVVPDQQAIAEYVQAHYPLPKAPSGPIPVGHDPSSGQTILSDGSLRPPVAGDTYPGEMVAEGQRTIPKSVWKCPEKS